MSYQSIFENNDLYRENFRFLFKYYPQILPYLEEDTKHERFKLCGSKEKKNLNLYISGIKYYQINAYRYAYDRTIEKNIHDLFSFRTTYPYRSPYDTAYTGLINLINDMNKIPKNFWFSPHMMKKTFSKKHIIPWGFIYGIGLGLHIPLIIKKRKVKHLIILDHDPGFLRASMHVISWERDVIKLLQELGGTLHIFLGLAAYYPPNTQKENASRKLYEDIKNFIYAHPHAPLQQGSFFHCHVNDKITENNIHREIFYIASRAIGLHGSDIDEYIMNTNTYANIASFKSLSIIKQKNFTTKNIPIFIIGSAPSLTENLPFIKKKQKQALILACGSSISPILEAGICPDFYLQLENVSYISMTNFLLLGKHRIPKKTYAMFMNSVPTLASKGFNSVILIPRQTNSGYFFSHTIKQTFPELDAQSVVPMAFEIACHLNPLYIAFFGVDLSIIHKKNSHITGTLFYEENPWKRAFVDNELHVDRITRTLRGEPAYTNLLLEDIKKNLESLIVKQLSEKPNIKIFNCSHGLPILGTRAIRPESLFFQPQNKKKIYIKKIIQQTSPTHTFTKNLSKNFLESEKKIQKNLQQLFKIIDSINYFDELYNLPFLLTEQTSIYVDNIYSTSIHLNVDFLSLFLHTYVDMIPSIAKKQFLESVKKYFCNSLQMTYNMINAVTKRYTK